MTVESERSRWKREMGSFVAKWVKREIERPRFPSAFSKSIGFILWGIVDEPISPATFFYVKYPKEIYPHISRQKSIKIVFVCARVNDKSAIES